MGKTVDFSSIFSNFWALCKAHHPKCLDGETLCKCKLDFICLDNNGKESGVSTSGLTGSQSGQTFGSITVIIVSLVSSTLITAIKNIYFLQIDYDDVNSSQTGNDYSNNEEFNQPTVGFVAPSLCNIFGIKAEKGPKYFSF